MASNPISKLTEEQYLALDRAAEFKSEFLDGEMFAMAGASRSHDRLQQNLAFELRGALRGSGCEVLSSDIRIKVSGRTYFYADVSVASERMAEVHDDNLTNPVAIFEVSSPATQRFDRDLKFQRYQSIESLKDYVLVRQGQVHIEHFTRVADGRWRFRDLRGQDQELKIDSIGVAIPLQRIYDQVDILPATD